MNSENEKKFQYTFWNPEVDKMVSGRYEGLFLGKYGFIVRIGKHYVNLNYDLQNKFYLIKDILEVGKTNIKIVYKGQKDVGKINKMRIFDVFCNGKIVETNGGLEPATLDELKL